MHRHGLIDKLGKVTFLKSMNAHGRKADSMAKFEIIAVLRLSADKTAVGGRLLDEYAPAARQMQVGDLTMQILGNYPEEMLVGETAILT